MSLIALMLTLAPSSSATPIPNEADEDAAAEDVDANEAGDEAVPTDEEGSEADSEDGAEGDPMADDAPVEVPEVVQEAAPMPALATFEASNRVEIEEAPGDVFATGDDLRVTGNVGDNAFLLGRQVTISEPVDGDVVAMGMNVRVDAPVGGDLYAMGQEVVVTGDGSIGGTVIAASQNLTLNGPVTGSVSLRAAEMKLGNTIGGDAKLNFGRAQITNKAAIAGDVRYVAPEAQPDLKEATTGEVAFSLVDDGEEEPPGGPMFILQNLLYRVIGIIGNFVAQFALGALMLLALGKLAQGPGKTAAKQPVISFVLGAAVLIVVPIVSGFLGLSAVALPFGLGAVVLQLGVIGISLWGLGVYAARLMAALMVGEIILKRASPARARSPYWNLATGLAPLVILSAIPWFGWAVFLAASAVGLGGVWLYLRDEAHGR
ncbi:MAG: polymer-forming cytoskeletal protein [Myxococcales bacterium]|nr:polymer-forming cytoskeletal protein [Myxococcales bacterium]